MSLVAYGSTVIGVAGLMKDAYQLYKSLKDAFSSTTISKRDLRAAEAIFENYPLEHWDEQVLSLWGVKPFSRRFKGPVSIALLV